MFCKKKSFWQGFTCTTEIQSVKRKLPNECDNSAKRKKVEKENVYNNLEDICSGMDFLRYGRNSSSNLILWN